MIENWFFEVKGCLSLYSKTFSSTHKRMRMVIWLQPNYLNKITYLILAEISYFIKFDSRTDLFIFFRYFFHHLVNVTQTSASLPEEWAGD